MLVEKRVRVICSPDDDAGWGMVEVAGHRCAQSELCAQRPRHGADVSLPCDVGRAEDISQTGGVAIPVPLGSAVHEGD